jgi:hypothetical protein
MDGPDLRLPRRPKFNLGRRDRTSIELTYASDQTAVELHSARLPSSKGVNDSFCPVPPGIPSVIPTVLRFSWSERTYRFDMLGVTCGFGGSPTVVPPSGPPDCVAEVPGTAAGVVPADISEH